MTQKFQVLDLDAPDLPLLRQTVTETGFLLLHHPHIDRQKAALHNLGLTFFREAPPSVKTAPGLQLSAAHHWRGYSGLGSEITLGRPDYHECLDFGRDRPVDDRPGFEMQGPNNFPEPEAQWRAACAEYAGFLGGLGRELLRNIAIAFGLRADLFEALFEGDYLLRLVYYPRVAEEEEEEEVVGIGEHSDYGCLTLLSADRPGLQVKLRNGAWVSVPVLPNTVVVNFGDMLQHWTAGLLRATPHRVLWSNRTQDRLSIPYFFEPPFDSIISPLPEFVALSKNEQNWAISPNTPQGLHYGRYLTAKYQQSYPSDQSGK